jgi:hypothetical protein
LVEYFDAVFQEIAAEDLKTGIEPEWRCVAKRKRAAAETMLNNTVAVTNPEYGGSSLATQVLSDIAAAWPAVPPSEYGNSQPKSGIAIMLRQRL